MNRPDLRGRRGATRPIASGRAGPPNSRCDSTAIIPASERRAPARISRRSSRVVTRQSLWCSRACKPGALEITWPSPRANIAMSPVTSRTGGSRSVVAQPPPGPAATTRRSASRCRSFQQAARANPQGVRRARRRRRGVARTHDDGAVRRAERGRAGTAGGSPRVPRRRGHPALFSALTRGRLTSQSEALRHLGAERHMPALVRPSRTMSATSSTALFGSWRAASSIARPNSSLVTMLSGRSRLSVESSGREST